MPYERAPTTLWAVALSKLLWPNDNPIIKPAYGDEPDLAASVSCTEYTDLWHGKRVRQYTQLNAGAHELSNQRHE